METEERTKSKSAMKFVSVGLILLILFGGYAGAYYFYNKYKQTKIVLDNPSIATQKEVKEVVDKLGIIMELPTDEDPSVATVLDKEKIKDQPFFAKAENGDKVVIYSKAKIAILFRMAANKIINVSPVSLDQPVATETPTTTAKPKVTAQPEVSESPLP